MKKRIIVCGYPKSGNTWLTRLTAQIVGCPVVGFWCEPFNEEEAIEGLDRISDYQSFKAHHSVHEMAHTLTYYAAGSEKIIYIIRDPRDIVVSGSHYFMVNPQYVVAPKLLASLPAGLVINNRVGFTDKYIRDTLTTGLLRGTSEGAWLHVPWKEHVYGYLNSGALIIQYETLITKPLHEAQRICEYLNIDRSDRELGQSIHIQSFEIKKNQLLEHNETAKANLLRRGRPGEWKTALSTENLNMINDELREILNELGYH